MDSKFSEFIQLCLDTNPCVDEGNGVSGLPWLTTKPAEYGDITLKQVLDLTANDPTAKSEWTLWTISHFGEQISPDVRLLYIRNTIKDSMTALKLYAAVDFLTEEEQTLLQSIFKGKL
jgi:hypothetical protein